MSYSKAVRQHKVRIGEFLFFKRVKVNYPGKRFRKMVGPAPASLLLHSSDGRVEAGVKADTSRVSMARYIRFDADGVGVAKTSDPLAVDLLTELNIQKKAAGPEWDQLYYYVFNKSSMAHWYFPAQEVFGALGAIQALDHVRGFVDESQDPLGKFADLVLFDEQTGDFVRVASQNEEFRKQWLLTKGTPAQSRTARRLGTCS